MAYKLRPTDKKETTAFLDSRLAKASSTNEITLTTVFKKPVSPMEVTHTQSNSNKLRPPAYIDKSYMRQRSCFVTFVTNFQLVIQGDKIFSP